MYGYPLSGSSKCYYLLFVLFLYLLLDISLYVAAIDEFTSPSCESSGPVSVNATVPLNSCGNVILKATQGGTVGNVYAVEVTGTTDSDDGGSSDALGSGAIAGIAIGAFVFVAVIVAGVVWSFGLLGTGVALSKQQDSELVKV